MRRSGIMSKRESIRQYPRRLYIRFGNPTIAHEWAENRGFKRWTVRYIAGLRIQFYMDPNAVGNPIALGVLLPGRYDPKVVSGVHKRPSGCGNCGEKDIEKIADASAKMQKNMKQKEA